MRLRRTGESRPRPADGGVGMNVGGPIAPIPAPARVVQEHCVRAPVEANPSASPSPRTEEPADAHAEAELDCAADHEAGPRRKEHDRGIVVGNHDKPRVDGHDGDIGSAADYDL